MEPNKKRRGDGGIDGWGRFPIRKGQFVDMVSQIKGAQPAWVTLRLSTGRDSRRGPILGTFMSVKLSVLLRG